MRSTRPPVSPPSPASIATARRSRSGGTTASTASRGSVVGAVGRIDADRRHGPRRTPASTASCSTSRPRRRAASSVREAPAAAAGRPLWPADRVEQRVLVVLRGALRLLHHTRRAAGRPPRSGSRHSLGRSPASDRPRSGGTPRLRVLDHVEHDLGHRRRFDRRCGRSAIEVGSWPARSRANSESTSARSAASRVGSAGAGSITIVDVGRRRTIVPSASSASPGRTRSSAASSASISAAISAATSSGSTAVERSGPRHALRPARAPRSRRGTCASRCGTRRAAGRGRRAARSICACNRPRRRTRSASTRSRAPSPPRACRGPARGVALRSSRRPPPVAALPCAARAGSSASRDRPRHDGRRRAAVRAGKDALRPRRASDRRRPALPRGCGRARSSAFAADVVARLAGRAQQRPSPRRARRASPARSAAAASASCSSSSSSATRSSSWRSRACASLSETRFRNPRTSASEKPRTPVPNGRATRPPRETAAACSR